MSTNFNDTTPAATSGHTNVGFQTDGSGNISAQVPTAIPATTPLPVTITSVAGEALLSYDSTTGLFTQGALPGPTVNPQTASYIAVLADGNNIVTMDVAGANTFTIPPNSSVAFPVGSTLTVIQKGAGQVTLTQGAGVTINTASSLTTRAQWSTVAMVQILTDVWVAGGDLT